MVFFFNSNSLFAGTAWSVRIKLIYKKYYTLNNFKHIKGIEITLVSYKSKPTNSRGECDIERKVQL